MSAGQVLPDLFRVMETHGMKLGNNGKEALNHVTVHGDRNSAGPAEVSHPKILFVFQEDYNSHFCLIAVIRSLLAGHAKSKK
jgi:hypothetical protein